MKYQAQTTNTIIPSDVAKYFLYRAIQDGELVSPLKMQKLLYYAYSWTLVKNKKKLFDLKDPRTLEAALYGLKFKGCSISQEEVELMKKL